MAAKSNSRRRRRDAVTNAIPQKVLLFAARIAKTPAIADEPADEEMINALIASDAHFRALIEKSKRSPRKPFGRKTKQATKRLKSK